MYRLLLLCLQFYFWPFITLVLNYFRSVSVESTVTVNHLPSSSDDEGEGLEGEGASSPTSARLYLPKPRLPVQRRATITGASPLSKRAPVNLQQVFNIT